MSEHPRDVALFTAETCDSCAEMTSQFNSFAASVRHKPFCPVRFVQIDTARDDATRALAERYDIRSALWVQMHTGSITEFKVFPFFLKERERAKNMGNQQRDPNAMKPQFNIGEVFQVDLERTSARPGGGASRAGVHGPDASGGPGPPASLRCGRLCQGARRGEGCIARAYRGDASLVCVLHGVRVQI